eukprot:GILI01030351.1.p2 GENE.GILI01030351.1~~GILI01030351.1.p2  ORF type:complete len:129 (+),score=18.18 GILI01030351.1:3-389(+)
MLLPVVELPSIGNPFGAEGGADTGAGGGPPEGITHSIMNMFTSDDTVNDSLISTQPIRNIEIRTLSASGHDSKAAMRTLPPRRFCWCTGQCAATTALLFAASVTAFLFIVILPNASTAPTVVFMQSSK